MSAPELLEVVVAAVDIPDQNIRAGDPGTVIEIYTLPALAYEVEFVNADGTLRALAILGPEQIRRLTPAEEAAQRRFLRPSPHPLPEGEGLDDC
jgi:hypothetical protein